MKSRKSAAYICALTAMLVLSPLTVLGEDTPAPAAVQQENSQLRTAKQANLRKLPNTKSDKLEAGKAIVGDFRQMALLDRSGLTVEAFNQHKDYASRNLTYVRAELRAAQVIWRPANFVVLEAK